MVKHHILVAIDPGLTGAVAIFRDGVPEIHDMPVIADRTGGKKSVDINGVIELIPEGTDLVVLEQQQSMPKQGIASTFQTGLNYGRLLGLLVTLALPHKIVTPRAWSKDVGRPAKSGKEWNIAEARRRWPELTKILLKSKDGRADALLIGASALGMDGPEPEEAPPVEGKDEPVVLPAW